MHKGEVDEIFVDFCLREDECSKFHRYNSVPLG